MPSRLFPTLRWSALLFFVCAASTCLLDPSAAADGLKTWDGQHAIDKIEVTLVYFVPKDRPPLPDWKERVDYYARRIERFHAREYGGQSQLTTKVHAEPLKSARSTRQLRSGDGDFVFFQTLRETDAALQFATKKSDAFPILLVMSEINLRPLDDFYRLREEGDRLVFEGNLSGEGRHFPGSALGGARATYLSNEGKGWGLVSADGWRVPYAGSDCVVYHEGVGHTVGLPHPEPGNRSVMSLAQYHGWISESWLDDDQKQRLGWKKPDAEFDRGSDLYSTFRAIPEPAVPKPGETVQLNLDWPKDVHLKSLRVRFQTDLLGPWVDVPTNVDRPMTIPFGPFDRPTPVSYRVDVELTDGQTVELWGYFQVRDERDEPPLPARSPVEFAGSSPAANPPLPGHSDQSFEPVDLLGHIRPERDAVNGKWTLVDGVLESPNAFGARIEIAYEPPPEYRLIAVVEPLEEPNALNLGQRAGENRFLALFNFGTGDEARSALENVDGQNVGANATTIPGRVFRKGEPSQVICTVWNKGESQTGVQVSVDGKQLIDWEGDSSQLSLSDYWDTPHKNVLFIGAYACRYRITRLTLIPLAKGGGPRSSP